MTGDELPEPLREALRPLVEQVESLSGKIEESDAKIGRIIFWEIAARTPT